MKTREKTPTGTEIVIRLAYDGYSGWFTETGHALVHPQVYTFRLLMSLGSQTASVDGVTVEPPLTVSTEAGWKNLCNLLRYRAEQGLSRTIRPFGRSKFAKTQ